jgi:hypothetical protein
MAKKELKFPSWDIRSRRNHRSLDEFVKQVSAAQAKEHEYAEAFKR